jgi:hypothetical protein
MAISFWERLGFARAGGDSNYIIMAGWGCEVQLTQVGTGPWRMPEENNPFGVLIRTPDVDTIAARVDDLIIRPGGVLRHREWGLYEVGICGHDGMLVRIGWRPSCSKVNEHNVFRAFSSASDVVLRHTPSDVSFGPNADIGQSSQQGAIRALPSTSCADPRRRRSTNWNGWGLFRE